MTKGMSSIPELEDQKHKIGQLSKKILVKQDTWCLIATKWYKQWKKYVGYDNKETANIGDRATHPSFIDNSSLLCDDGSAEIKDYLIDELDYVLLPEEAWDLLVKWYGLVAGQQPISRKVIEYGLFVKSCKVEVYLLEFKLCSYSNLEHVVTKKFSKFDTIGYIEQEMRSIFNINDNKEIRLWSKYCHNTYELLRNTKCSLYDVRLYNGQVIVIEERNDIGTWPIRVESEMAECVSIRTPELEDQNVEDKMAEGTSIIPELKDQENEIRQHSNKFLVGQDICKMPECVWITTPELEDQNVEDKMAEGTSIIPELKGQENEIRQHSNKILVEQDTCDSEAISYIVVPASNSMPAEFFDLSEFSLSPKPPLSTDENKAVSVVAGSSDSSHVHMTLSADLSVKEVQDHLIELLKDNDTIKDALKLNNDMMKEQLNTMSQMAISMLQQNRSLKEANGKLQEQEKEIAELHKKIEELETRPANVPDADISKKLQDDVSTIKHLIMDRDEIITELMNKIGGKNSEIDILKKSSEEKDKEDIALQTKQQEFETMYQDQLNKIQKSELNSMDLQSSEVLLSECSDLIFKLKCKIASEKYFAAMERKKHVNTRKLCSVLQSKYDRVEQWLEVHIKDHKVENVFADSKYEQAENLTANLIDTEQKLEEDKIKASEINSLKDTKHVLIL